VDPLMMSSSSTMGTPRLSRPTAVHSASSDSQQSGISPPIPAPYAPPFGNAYGYHEVPTSEPQYFDGQHRSRVYSQVSPQSPPMGQNAFTENGYFADPALRDQNLRFGHPPSRPSVQSSHGRQLSDTSVESQQSSNSEGIAELEAGGVEDSPSALQRAMHGMGLSRPRGGHRRRSSEVSLLAHRRSDSNGSGFGRQETPSTPGFGARLENVVESDLDHFSTATGASPHSRRPAGEPNTGTSDLAGQQVHLQTGIQNAAYENPTKKDSARPQPGAVPETSNLTNLNVEQGTAPEQALDLEQELVRLEGQKMIGRGLDLLGDRNLS